jgi:hypothetical protein
MKIPTTLRALVLGANLTLLSGASFSAALVFTDRSEFESYLVTSHTETFSSLFPGTELDAPLSQSADAATAGFQYNFEVLNGTPTFYVDQEGANTFLTTFDLTVPNLGIRANFTSGNVTAVGADFFITDNFGDATSGAFTIELSDGTSQMFSVSGFRLFVGFVSDTPITSLSFGNISDAPGAYAPALDNVQVGAAVPELSETVAFAGLGLLAFAAIRRVRARKA